MCADDFRYTKELNNFLLSRAGANKYGVTDVRKYTNSKHQYRSIGLQNRTQDQTSISDSSTSSSPTKKKKMSIKQEIAMKKTQKAMKRLEQS